MNIKISAVAVVSALSALVTLNAQARTCKFQVYNAFAPTQLVTDIFPNGALAHALVDPNTTTEIEASDLGFSLPASGLYQVEIPEQYFDSNEYDVVEVSLRRLNETCFSSVYFNSLNCPLQNPPLVMNFLGAGGGCTVVEDNTGMGRGKPIEKGIPAPGPNASLYPSQPTLKYKNDKDDKSYVKDKTACVYAALTAAGFTEAELDGMCSDHGCAAQGGKCKPLGITMVNTEVTDECALEFPDVQGEPGMKTCQVRVKAKQSGDQTANCRIRTTTCNCIK
jgi:hypothetical protein